MIVNNINPYLMPTKNVWVNKESKPMSKTLPKMTLGSCPADGGFLHLTLDEKSDLLEQHPEANPIIKQIIGSQEALKGIERYCLWITEELLPLAISIPDISNRISSVKEMREASKKEATVKLARSPHRFSECRHTDSDSSLVIPIVSSGSRRFIATAFLSSKEIVNDSAFVIGDANKADFSILSSSMQRCWLAAVGGKLVNEYRYSNTMVWNTFPMPDVTDEQKEKLNQTGQAILNARHYHPDLTLGDMYNPENMGPELLAAHKENDKVLESIFRDRPFKSDEERLAHLLECYTNMVKKL